MKVLNLHSGSVCKRFTFDAAHQLPNHDGKCCQLHGHTYNVLVYAYGEVQPVDGRSSGGMVVDFDIISKCVKEYVIDKCDHKFLIPRCHPEVEIEVFEKAISVHFMTKNGACAYRLTPQDCALLAVENTTAEGLAAWILQEVHGRIPQVYKVAVYETPNSFAGVTLDDIESANENVAIVDVETFMNA